MGSTWAGHVDKNGRYNICKDNRCPESGGEMEAKKTGIAMVNCIKSDIENILVNRCNVAWRRMEKIIDRRNWRLLSENIVRDK